MADVETQPSTLVKSILKGISDTGDADFQRLSFEEEKINVINAISNSVSTAPNDSNDQKPKMSSVKKVTGGMLPISRHS